MAAIGPHYPALVRWRSTHAEIGRLLDVPEGTVASWTSRGRAQLRELLGLGAMP